MRFAQNLNNILIKRKMTRYRLAKELGVHQTTVRNWVDGLTTPKFEMIEKIAKILEVDPLKLAHGEDIYAKVGESFEEAGSLKLLGIDPNFLYDKANELNNNNELTTEIDYKETNKAIQLKNDTISKYDSLNALGQQKANEYITDLSEQEKYTKPDEE